MSYSTVSSNPHALDPDIELNESTHISSSHPSISIDSSAAGSAVGVERHKVACFFHVLFKGSAIALYILCSLFFDNFVSMFVACVILLAFDFWTVKNVTGRILVGLRWWNEVREDGTDVWIFESKPDTRPVHPSDSFLFWSTLYLTPVVWFVLGIGALTAFKFPSLLIIAVAITLSFANVIGYWKCQKDAGQRIRSFIAQRL